MPTPSVKWYLAEAGKSVGPFAAEQLSGLVQEGRLGPDTSVWRKGIAWTPAGQVPELQAVLGEAAPPPPEAAGAPAQDLTRNKCANFGALAEGNCGTKSRSYFASSPQQEEPKATEQAAEAGAAEEPAVEPEEGRAVESEAAATPAEAPADDPGGQESARVHGEGEPPRLRAFGASARLAEAQRAEAAGEPAGGPAAEGADADGSAAADETDERAGAAAGTVSAPAPPPRRSSPFLRAIPGLAAITLSAALLYAFYIYRVQGSRPNPFLGFLPKWGTDLLAWVILFYLPALGLMSGVGVLFGARWAHVGQIVFWILAGAGLGAAACAAPQATVEIRAVFGTVPHLPLAAGRVQALLGTLPLLTVLAGLTGGIALFGCAYLFWRLPPPAWARAAPGARQPPGDAAEAPPDAFAEEPAWGRRFCLLAFLGWAFVFLPWWGFNALAHAFRWGNRFLYPLEETLGVALPRDLHEKFFYALPVMAALGLLLPLGRWRPRRGSPAAARGFGLASAGLLALTGGFLPGYVLARERLFPKPPPEAEVEPADVGAPVETQVPPPPPRAPRGRAGPLDDLARRMEEADRRQREAASLIREVQEGVRSGRTGLKVKAERARELLGSSIRTYGEIQDALDARHEPVPAEVMRAIQHATESLKMIRMLSAEVR